MGLSYPGTAPFPEALLQRWTLTALRSVTPTEAGHNNRSWVVETADATHVLRLYDNLGERAIRFEHALLRHLGRAGLPFAVPAPVETCAGDTLCVVPGDGDDTIRAALFHFLPGRHPAPDDPVAAARLGEALAHLHPALKEAGAALGSPAVTGYGDLHHIHPRIADPLSVGDLLALEPEVKARLRRATQRALDNVGRLYSSLPTQLIHADYGHFNVLMAGGRVTAVLDFEFSCSDVRAMDLASGVRHFGHAAWFEGGDFDLAERFVRGYADVLPPDPAEIDALPDLMRLAEVVILIHWTGRWLQGIAERQQVAGAAGRALRVDAALEARGAELVERVRLATR